MTLPYCPHPKTPHTVLSISKVKEGQEFRQTRQNRKYENGKEVKRNGKYVDDVGIGIRQVTELDFLKKHKVKVQKSPPGTPLMEADLLKKGSGFVSQIGCWN